MGINHIDALILGAIQGFTEFIPVSSSAHMALFHMLRTTSFSPEVELAYDAVLQLATLGAVLVFFWNDIVSILKNIVQKDFSYALRIIIATLPAVILGLFLESYIETVFRSVYMILGALILGSGIMILAEKFIMRTQATSEEGYAVQKLPLISMVYIGLFQALALIPGMSRSGMTISGGIFMGLNRMNAVRFSFILSIPIIAGSGVLKFIDSISMPEIPYLSLGISFITAFVCGLISIAFLIKIIAHKNFWPFIWYRCILAIMVVILIIFI